VAPDGRRECFFIVVAASGFIWSYSAPPLRTKRLLGIANLTIAAPRGLLLTVSGWSSVETVMNPEPWFLGLIFALFLLGATSTKDFPDIRGDRLGGCETLPIRYGPKGAVLRIAPFFVLPFLLLPVGVRTGWLTGNPLLLGLLGFGLALYGSYCVWLMGKSPEKLSTARNHASWRHMYVLMLLAQAGLAAAYLIP